MLCQSFYATIAKSQNYQLNTDQLLGDILDEMWRRNMKIPALTRDDIVRKLEDRNLRNMFQNVPVLGNRAFDRSSNRGTV